MDVKALVVGYEYAFSSKKDFLHTPLCRYRYIGKRDGKYQFLFITKRTEKYNTYSIIDLIESEINMFDIIYEKI